MLGIFNCNFIHMNKHIFKILYKSLVQPIRLSLVWPIDFQYNRLQMCSLCQNGGGFHSQPAVQTFKEAESSVLEFKVIGPYSVNK